MDAAWHTHRGVAILGHSDVHYLNDPCISGDRLIHAAAPVDGARS